MPSISARRARVARARRVARTLGAAGCAAGSSILKRGATIPVVLCCTLHMLRCQLSQWTPSYSGSVTSCGRAPLVYLARLRVAVRLTPLPKVGGGGGVLLNKSVGSDNSQATTRMPRACCFLRHGGYTFGPEGVPTFLVVFGRGWVDTQESGTPPHACLIPQWIPDPRTRAKIRTGGGYMACTNLFPYVF